MEGKEKEVLNMMQLLLRMEERMFRVIQGQKECEHQEGKLDLVLIMTLTYGLIFEKLLLFSKLHALWMFYQMFQRDYRVWKGRLRNGEKEEIILLYHKEQHTASTSYLWPCIFLNTLLKK